ncbi:uncharacterized protein LOC127734642 [Mytilus californianus]|uniref:uncharacterized protein LOC127734642 n=1 Tax=Mytilus californianus TaxID=6549 RepID=UPI0022481B5C|nr:uncharacterized protein LOC127734642 [Mytilus californianus]
MKDVKKIVKGKALKKKKLARILGSKKKGPLHKTIMKDVKKIVKGKALKQKKLADLLGSKKKKTMQKAAMKAVKTLVKGNGTKPGVKSVNKNNTLNILGTPNPTKPAEIGVKNTSKNTTEKAIIKKGNASILEKGIQVKKEANIIKAKIEKMLYRVNTKKKGASPKLALKIEKMADTKKNQVDDIVTQKNKENEVSMDGLYGANSPMYSSLMHLEVDLLKLLDYMEHSKVKMGDAFESKALKKELKSANKGNDVNVFNKQLSSVMKKMKGIDKKISEEHNKIVGY